MFKVIKAALEKKGVPGWLIYAFYGGIAEREADGIPENLFPEECE